MLKRAESVQKILSFLTSPLAVYKIKTIPNGPKKKHSIIFYFSDVFIFIENKNVKIEK